MENKYNIDDVNAWLKEQYGMSYDELSKEFNTAVDLLSDSLKQRKEMRNKINKAIEYIENTVVMSDGTKEKDTITGKDLLDILKEDK